MALPKQAQKQVEQANAILEGLQGDGEKPKMEIVDAPPVEPPAEDPPAEPPAEPLAAEAPDDPPKVEEPPKDEVDWEQRYKVLQGKYDSEVPELHGQLKEIKQLLATMQEPAPKEPESKPVDPIPSKFVTKEDIDEYGEDFFGAVERKAKELYEPQLNTLKTELASLKAQLGGVTSTVVESSRDKFFAQLDAEVEDWRELNTADDFLHWLDATDPYSGEQRGKLLTAAVEAYDAKRAIAFFTGFKNEHAAVAPQPAADSVVAEQPGTPAVDLNDHVAPGKGETASSPPASAQSPKRIWTRAQIAEFYKDAQLGKFKNDPAKKLAIEKDINLAMHEGRIK